MREGNHAPVLRLPYPAHFIAVGPGPACSTVGTMGPGGFRRLSDLPPATLPPFACPAAPFLHPMPCSAAQVPIGTATYGRSTSGACLGRSPLTAHSHTAHTTCRRSKV